MEWLVPGVSASEAKIVNIELENYCIVEENILDKLMPRALFADSYIRLS